MIGVYLKRCWLKLVFWLCWCTRLVENTINDYNSKTFCTIKCSLDIGNRAYKSICRAYKSIWMSILANNALLLSKRWKNISYYKIACLFDLFFSASGPCRKSIGETDVKILKWVFRPLCNIRSWFDRDQTS